MKKIVILSMLLVLAVMAFAVNLPRTYSQKLSNANFLLSDYISNASSVPNTNYKFEVTITSSPGQTLSTETSGVAIMGVYKLSTSYYARIYLANFTNQWVMNDVVHCKLTFIQPGVHFGEFTEWDMIIPDNTATTINPTVLQPAPPLPVTGITVNVSSNIVGAAIYDIGNPTGWTTPHTFTEVVGAHTYTVENIPTQITPPAQSITGSEPSPVNIVFTYTDPAGTVGGNGSSVLATAPGEVTIPTTTGATVTGTVNAPGLLVVTQITPGKAGNYHGYMHVETVYQVYTNNTLSLNGGSLSFNYGIPAGYKYVAVHWGGVNSGYWPVDQPETVGIPTPGYVFNGGIPGAIPYMLGMAPFTAANYAAGILTIAPITVYDSKGPGTFEIILGKDVDLPVTLSSFNAVATAQMFVNLQWTTESETNNLGFNVFRSNDSNVASASQVNFNIINGTNTTTSHNYNFVDNSVDPETTYYYWLQMVDFDGTSHFSNSVMVATLGETPIPTTPDVTVLRSAYPNPFNVSTSTNIEMDVKTGETASLTIYNVLGQTVKTYVRQAGSHKLTWNGRDEKGAVCGSGIYFYKLSSPSVNSTKKMVIVK